MTKRMRGSTRTHRPGTRPPINRPAGARPVRRSTSDGALTTPSSAAATTPELVAEATEARAQASVAESPRVPRATPITHARPRAKPGSVLAARAANEYVYVAQDIRRILIVSAVLFSAMIVVWLLIVVLKVIPIAFY
jgi:hypothetical protein